jgi:H+/Cl- antiporter ClcA
MLPVDEAWYRRLLVLALGLGLAGGVFALLYSGITLWGIGRLFGDPSHEPWSGQWWWVPLVAAGAVLVVFLRQRAGVDGPVPGAIALARRGWVEPRTAVPLTLLSAISLIAGASLGPSFGVIVAAGGLGSWLVSRRTEAQDGERTATALTAMSGGLGALFAAPLFAAIMASELSPIPKRGYVAAFVPQLLAATVGFVIFFGVTGAVMLDSFDVPGYAFRFWHLLVAAGIGLLAIGVLLLQLAINAVVTRVADRMDSRYLRAAVLGALVGLVAFALPLTATGGSSQLAYETDRLPFLSAGLLAAVLLGKMFAFSASQAAGFLGGAVFPMLFIGGTAGAIVHALLPDVPMGLAVAGMMAAVPGATIGAPVSFVLIGVGTVGLGVEAIPGISVAVVVAHIGASVLAARRRARTAGAAEETPAAA